MVQYILTMQFAYNQTCHVRVVSSPYQENTKVFKVKINYIYMKSNVKFYKYDTFNLETNLYYINGEMMIQIDNHMFNFIRFSSCFFYKEVFNRLSISIVFIGFIDAYSIDLNSLKNKQKPLKKQYSKGIVLKFGFRSPKGLSRP